MFNASRTARKDVGSSARTAAISARSLANTAHVSMSSQTCPGASGAIAWDRRIDSISCADSIHSHSRDEHTFVNLAVSARAESHSALGVTNSGFWRHVLV